MLGAQMMTAVKHSGAIWGVPARRRSQIVRRVCERLRAAYGTPRLGNPRAPLDDLVYITLTNKTAPRSADAAYSGLKNAFPYWDAMLAAPARKVRRILTPAGLSRIKTAYLREAMRRIRADFGTCSLAALRGQPEGEAERYLVSLPGVSLKVAKCVMLFTLGARVLPVDAHVHRVAGRLGWTARKRADQCHEELEALVRPRWRYGFHVGAVQHGRTVCKPRAPACEKCCIRMHCMLKGAT
jgi:endonuclease III